jgi:hypothetical protein
MFNNVYTQSKLHVGVLYPRKGGSMKLADDGPVFDPQIVLSTFFPVGCIFYWHPKVTGGMLPVNALSTWNRYRKLGLKAACEKCTGKSKCNVST